MNSLKKFLKTVKNIPRFHQDAVEKSYIGMFRLQFKEPEMLKGFIEYRRNSMIYWTGWVFLCGCIHHLWQTLVEF